LRRIGLFGPAALAALVVAAAASASSPAISAVTSFTPRVHAFADTVTATVTVSVDPSRIDPATVRVAPSFDPYRAVPQPEQRDRTAGGLVMLGFPFRISCSTDDCLPDAGERTIALAPARVVWRDRDGAPRGATVAWPPLLVASRLTKSDLASPSFPTELAPPPPRYALPPGLLGDGLLALGALLGAGGVGTVAVLAHRRRRTVPVEPLQRALELVETAARGDVVDRRRALYQLALVLEDARLEPESWAARKLAWAPAMPDPEGMQLLSLVIRQQLAEATA
jgi:hypothetical protein